MNATGNDLLQAILDDPASDERRLIYADWLDDQGEAERAEFIRVQCELAAMSKPPTLDRQMEVGRRRVDQNWGPVEDYVSACRDDERELYLRRRERELLIANWNRWVPYIEPGRSMEVILSDKWQSCETPACVFRRRGALHAGRLVRDGVPGLQRIRRE